MLNNRFDVTNSLRLQFDCDLSEAAVDEATKLLRKTMDDARFLIVSQDNAVEAGRHAQRLGLAVIVLDIIKPHSWALCGELSVVSSPGA